jgi:arginase
MTDPFSSVQLIVSPYDSGHFDTRMGAGPLALLRAGAAARLRADGYAVEETVIEPTTPWHSELRTAFQLQRRIAVEATRAHARHALPIVLAGNCNATLGSLGALTASGPRVGLIWLDAHGDFNDPDHDESGFLDGQGLAMAVGRCWRAAASRIPGFVAIAEEDVVLIGSRDLSPAQRETLAESGVDLLAPESARNLDAVRASFNVLSERVDVVHIHVDVDVYDPSIAPANEYAAPGGLLAREVRDIVTLAAERLPIASATLASYDPAFDPRSHLSSTALDLLQHIARLARR